MLLNILFFSKYIMQECNSCVLYFQPTRQISTSSAASNVICVMTGLCNVRKDDEFGTFR